MFWINKTRAEKAAMIIAGYCDKQLTCDKCRFADEKGGLTTKGFLRKDVYEQGVYDGKSCMDKRSIGA